MTTLKGFLISTFVLLLGITVLGEATANEGNETTIKQVIVSNY